MTKNLDRCKTEQLKKAEKFVTRKCPQIFPIFSCHDHENKFVHVATKKNIVVSLHLSPSATAEEFLSGMPGVGTRKYFILSSQFVLPDIFWDTFLAFGTRADFVFIVVKN